MSTDESLFDEQFLEATNKLIEIANEMGGKYGDHKMGVAFIYAAARYNAYIAAGSVTSADELADKRDKAVEYFTDELWSFLVYGEIEGWRILLIDSGKNHNQQRMIRHDPVYPESAFTTRRTGNRSADRVVTQRCTRVDRTSR
jgi:hypothetical protein